MLHDLRSSLQPLLDAPLIIRQANRYRLDPDQADIDLWQLHAAARAAAHALTTTDRHTAQHAVIDHYRRNAAGRKALEAHAREAPEADPGFDADLERTVCACVNDLVPVLKPEYADLIRRVDLGGADVTSAADALGMVMRDAGACARQCLRLKQLHSDQAAGRHAHGRAVPVAAIRRRIGG